MADNYRSFLNLFHLFAEVALVVEITEEENEADTIAKHHNIHGVREVALCEQVVSCVHCQKHKLHLQEDRSKHKDQRLTNICVPDIVVIQPEQPFRGQGLKIKPNTYPDATPSFIIARAFFMQDTVLHCLRFISLTWGLFSFLRLC